MDVYYKMESKLKYDAFCNNVTNIIHYLEELRDAPDFPLLTRSLPQQHPLSFYQSVHTFIYILTKFISISGFDNEDIKDATECQKEDIENKWQYNISDKDLD